jgi:hypothetical protein
LAIVERVALMMLWTASLADISQVIANSAARVVADVGY